MELTKGRVRELCRDFMPAPKKTGRPRKSIDEALTLADDVGIAEACRRTGVARTTIYRHKKWKNQKTT